MRSLQLKDNGTDYLTTVTGYDITNRITRMLMQGGAATLENITYAYDANGNRTSYSRLGGQALSPVVASTNHDDANEMLALDGKTFSYDANGNLQSRTDVCGTTSYTWDARNRLVGLSGFMPGCTALSASFSYDALRDSGDTIPIK